MPKSSFNYQAVAGDYQYRAMLAGPPLQRFWHTGKLLVWDELIAPRVRNEPQFPLIEVGCGAGLLLQHLVQEPVLKVGTDINFQALRFLNQRFIDIGNPQLFLAIMSKGEQLPFKDDYFGGVILSEVIEHLSHPEILLNEAYRILRPGGWCYITTPNYRSFWPFLEKVIDRFDLAPRMAGEQHISLFDQKKLIRLLKDWQLEILTSFYRFSPLFSMISMNWGKRLLKRECRSNNKSGMLLACLARKPH